MTQTIVDEQFHPGTALTFEAFRSGFPACRNQTYLSICDKMILHDDVRASIDQFLDHLALASANRVQHEVRVKTAREKFARLVRVAPETVAAVRNVSDGINSIAWALDWRPGDNVVLTADCEHPNNIYPWLRQKERGMEIRVIEPQPDGAIDEDALIAAIDGRTRVMAVASATFAPGHRSNLAKLGEACRKRDVFLLVDGVQTAGIMDHDLDAEQVDGFATSTSKGLLGLYGFGFLYVSPKWIDRLKPAYLSRPAIVQKTDDHSTMGAFDYEYQPDSRRFEVGSFNLAGAYATDASLDMLLRLGSEAIQKRVLRLAGEFHAGLCDLGITPAVPGSGPRQSHIITLGAINAGGHGFSTDPLIQPLSEHLAQCKVAHTIRRGQMRFGLHAYNNQADITTALDAIGQGVKKLKRT
ncbi:aminotransferase class V-fold PLP-dependent enzyme [Alcaligenaceae bacterium]|nr:aminotransferase class V-fold PLP-dependent enzyme [Alcaligenaceae bacterium]